MKKTVLPVVACGLIVTLLSGCSCLMKKKDEVPAAPAKAVEAPADFQSTPSGLMFKVLQPAPADAKMVEAGKNVTVQYTGWLQEKGQPEDLGKKFDSSFDHGSAFTFTVGAGNVIKGWDEGVALMKVGEKRRFVIPSELAYGAQGANDIIPSNANLIFDVEVVSA